MKSGFFGLNVEGRPYIFQSIFDLVYHGKGGFIYSEVYDMPIWLRNYNLMKLQDIIKKENDANNPEKPKGQELQKMPDEIKKIFINKSKIPIKNDNPKQ